MRFDELQPVYLCACVVCVLFSPSGYSVSCSHFGHIKGNRQLQNKALLISTEKFGWELHQIYFQVYVWVNQNLRSAMEHKNDTWTDHRAEERLYSEDFHLLGWWHLSDAAFGHMKSVGPLICRSQWAAFHFVLTDRSKEIAMDKSEILHPIILVFSIPSSTRPQNISFPRRRS